MTSVMIGNVGPEHDQYKAIFRGSAGLNDQKNGRTVPDIEHFMPLDTLVVKMTTGFNGYLTGAGRIRDAHRASGQCVTEMWSVIVPFMAYPWRETAPEHPQLIVFFQYFAYSLAIPSRLQRIR